MLRRYWAQMHGHVGSIQLNVTNISRSAVVRRSTIQFVFILAVLQFSAPTFAKDPLPPPDKLVERVSKEEPNSESESRPQLTAIDSTFSATTLGGRYLELNMNFAPWGIYETGPRIRFTGAGYAYQFLANDDPWTLGSGQGFETRFLVGYGIVTEKISWSLLVGPSYSGNWDDTGGNKSALGIAAIISAYATPTDDVMAWGSASYSSLSLVYQVQGKFGFKVDKSSYYIGPEVLVSGLTTGSEQNISQQQYGLHVSSIPIGPGWFSFSGGLDNEARLGLGGYFTVSFYCCRAR
jgi:hypothetical protein